MTTLLARVNPHGWYALKTVTWDFKRRLLKKNLTYLEIRYVVMGLFFIVDFDFGVKKFRGPLKKILAYLRNFDVQIFLEFSFFNLANLLFTCKNEFRWFSLVDILNIMWIFGGYIEMFTWKRSLLSFFWYKLGSSSAALSLLGARNPCNIFESKSPVGIKKIVTREG